MTALFDYGLLPWEQTATHHSVNDNTDGNGRIYRLWAGFAALTLGFSSIVLTFSDVRLPGAAASIVTPAQADIKEASVTPTQVDLRISRVVGMLESRLAALENDRPRMDTSSLIPAGWEKILSPDIPFSMDAASLPGDDASASPENSAAPVADDVPEKRTNMVQVPSRLVKTYSVSTMPAETLPLPLETPLP